MQVQQKKIKNASKDKLKRIRQDKLQLRISTAADDTSSLLTKGLSNKDFFRASINPDRHYFSNNNLRKNSVNSDDKSQSSPDVIPTQSIVEFSSRPLTSPVNTQYRTLTNYPSLHQSNNGFQNYSFKPHQSLRQHSVITKTQYQVDSDGMKRGIRIKTIRLNKAHSSSDLRSNHMVEFGTDRYKERLNRFI
ncbi:UNKNOWN [Stylonychia lemnae]|uniref:Uncharacterized protein n=1 Tax=Stylonychia lemnae TaxID=5949 RepID=A0A078AHJ6_STYLE|nr:UNKNOWN [Stylonychia lemnae]|eukprot:CDW81336.1 UNKNOWN [Stylonychia lemnae]